MKKVMRVLPLLATIALFAMVVQSSLLAQSAAPQGGGNQDCPAGTVLIAKFNWSGSTYVYETGLGSGAVTITNGTAAGGSWSSSYVISDLVVKGATNSVVVNVNPDATSGTFTKNVLPPNGGGQIPNISNIKFCGPGTQPTPTDDDHGNPNDDCENYGLNLIAKFEWDDDSYSYAFEKPAGNEGLVIILNGTPTGGDWHSLYIIYVVIIKGGTGTDVDFYNPAAVTGSFTNTGLPPVGNGNIPDISNIQFCGDPVEATDTPTPTIPPATNTDVPPTATNTDVPPTNTEVPPTNTEVPPTNTDVPPTATNTDVPPTNTEVPPTNTEVPPTNTEVPPTNTDVPPTATDEVYPTETPVPTETDAPGTEEVIP